MFFACHGAGRRRRRAKTERLRRRMRAWTMVIWNAMAQPIEVGQGWQPSKRPCVDVADNPAYMSCGISWSWWELHDALGMCSSLAV